MSRLRLPSRRRWLPVTLALGVAVGAAIWSGAYLRRPPHETHPAAGNTYRPADRSHMDHGAYFSKPFETPQDVTRACLECHPQAAKEVMRTAHWEWLGEEVVVPGHEGTRRIGKKNLINNFCISSIGNEVSCMKCHAGYGWSDSTFDFSRSENVDCLVCHEHSGSYVKGEAGLPKREVDLLAAARSVGTPSRENCGVCHNYGGGGQGVKHGDLDSSLDNPSEQDDVHMGRVGMLCVDCHRATEHRIPGRSFSVSVEGANGVACADCHVGPPHTDERLNAHLRSVACQTCHIPSYARRLPTKAFWDWSRAGDSTRVEDPHRYLKMKGEFLYDQDVVPEYAWFNRSVDRYLLGDRIDTTRVTDLNRPRGGIGDAEARIWPFKIHRALQPYDRTNAILLTPITGGPGGYWKTFDWDASLRLGSQAAGIPYSGDYGFTRTATYWPLSHMVTPKERALACDDCHGEGGRMDWAALGYAGDPIHTGGRP
jgi:octaheme c-type cytochrome (tetrathionate reductase family)